MYLWAHAKAAILHAAENNVSARCLAWFTNDNPDQHAKRLYEWIRSDAHPQIERDLWDAISDISDSSEWTKQTIRLANAYYTISYTYDEADMRFNEGIRRLLPMYTLDDCIDLIEGIQTNGQTWERRGAYTDHREVRKRALDLDPAFNPARFDIFNRRLG
jgi:hypothetical protein